MVHKIEYCSREPNQLRLTYDMSKHTTYMLAIYMHSPASSSSSQDRQSWVHTVARGDGSLVFTAQLRHLASLIVEYINLQHKGKELPLALASSMNTLIYVLSMQQAVTWDYNLETCW